MDPNNQQPQQLPNNEPLKPQQPQDTQRGVETTQPVSQPVVQESPVVSTPPAPQPVEPVQQPPVETVAEPVVSQPQEVAVQNQEQQQPLSSLSQSQPIAQSQPVNLKQVFTGQNPNLGMQPKKSRKKLVIIALVGTVLVVGLIAVVLIVMQLLSVPRFSADSLQTHTGEQGSFSYPAEFNEIDTTGIANFGIPGIDGAAYEHKAEGEDKSTAVITYVSVDSSAAGEAVVLTAEEIDEFIADTKKDPKATIDVFSLGTVLEEECTDDIDISSDVTEQSLDAIRGVIITASCNSEGSDGSFLVVNQLFLGIQTNGVIYYLNIAASEPVWNANEGVFTTILASIKPTD